MKRRDFIALLGGAAATWPLAARAQQPAMPMIGFLSTALRDRGRMRGRVSRSGLRELGWVEGRNCRDRIPLGGGRPERYAEVAAEFVRLKVDVIVTTGSISAPQPKRRPRPSRSFSRRGGPGRQRPRRELGAARRQRHRSVSSSSRVAGKRLELLRELVPDPPRSRSSPIRTLQRRSGRGERCRGGSSPRWRQSSSDVRERRRYRHAPSRICRAQRRRASLVCGDRFISQPRAHQCAGGSARGCRRSMPNRIRRGRRPHDPTEPTLRTCSGAPPIMSTGFSRAQSPPICRSSSRPSSSWSSTYDRQGARPRKSADAARPRRRGDRMRRRDFITLLGGAAATGRSRRARSSGDAGDRLSRRALAGRNGGLRGRIPTGLSEAGFIEGRTSRSSTAGRRSTLDRLPVLAAELVRRRSPLLSRRQPGAGCAAKAATSTIPIVFPTGGDPVGVGLVASLNRPGGNITGVTTFDPDLTGSVSAPASSSCPGTKSIAMLHNPQRPQSAG